MGPSKATGPHRQNRMGTQKHWAPIFWVRMDKEFLNKAEAP